MVFFLLHQNPPFHLPLLPSAATTRIPRTRPTHFKSTTARSSSSSSSMFSSSGKPAGLGMEFPFLPPVQRELMSDLLSTMDARLGSHLLPSDPLAFQNDSGTAKGALHVVSGSPDSPVDFILTSWIHSTLPSGGALDITTVFAFLNPDVTSAPHLLLELIQSSPTSLILLLDLLPRKDLVLDPHYLHRFYESLDFDAHRRSLAHLPSITPYVSSSLFIRAVLSPIAVCVNVGCEGATEMEEVVAAHVGATTRGVVGTWLERCVEVVGVVDGSTQGRADHEVEELRRRDWVIKKKVVEIDLTANLPRLFGEDVTKDVVTAIQNAFRV